MENYSVVKEQTETVAQLDQSSFKNTKPHLQEYIQLTRTSLGQANDSTKAIIDRWPEFRNPDLQFHHPHQYRTRSIHRHQCFVDYRTKRHFATE